MQEHALWAMEDRNQEPRARPVPVNVTGATSFERSDAKRIFEIPGECFVADNFRDKNVIPESGKLIRRNRRLLVEHVSSLGRPTQEHWGHRNIGDTAFH